MTIISSSIPKYLLNLIRNTHYRCRSGTKTFYGVVGVFKFVGYYRISNILNKRRENQGDLPDLNLSLEELNHYVNIYYNDIIKAIYKYDGDIAKFNDQGLIIFWPVESKEKRIEWIENESPDVNKQLLSEIIEKSVRCMLHLTKIVDNLNEKYYLELQTHLGLACGNCKLNIINSENMDFHDVILTGDALLQAYKMCSLSFGGGVELTKKVYDIIEDKEKCGNVISVEEGVFVDVNNNKFPFKNLDKCKDKTEDIKSLLELQQYLVLFLPENIREGVCSGPSENQKKKDANGIEKYTGWLSEVRRITICNILFPELTVYIYIYYLGKK